MLNECVDYITVRALPIFLAGPCGAWAKVGIGGLCRCSAGAESCFESFESSLLVGNNCETSFVYINFFLVTFSPLLVELSSYNPNPIIIYLFNL